MFTHQLRCWIPLVESVIQFTFLPGAWFNVFRAINRYDHVPALEPRSLWVATGR
jgi:hypothetical protein